MTSINASASGQISILNHEAGVTSRNIRTGDMSTEDITAEFEAMLDAAGGLNQAPVQTLEQHMRADPCLYLDLFWKYVPAVTNDVRLRRYLQHLSAALACRLETEHKERQAHQQLSAALASRLETAQKERQALRDSAVETRDT